MVWWLVLLSLGVGCGQAYGAYHWPRGGIFMVCVFTGCLFGIVAYSTFIGGYDFLIGPETTGLDAIDVARTESMKLWTCIAACSTAATIAGIVYFDYAASTAGLPR